MNADHFILMADIIGSRKKSGIHLMSRFKELVSLVNIQERKHLLSPLTITMGDEYQGIAHSLNSAIRILISMEEKIVTTGKPCRLRHVILVGTIDTPINTSSAHGMLGNGLTKARETLTSLKHRSWQKPDNLFKHARIRIVSPDKIAETRLNRLFLVYQGLNDRWKKKDLNEVTAFLKYRDYLKVAETMEKDKSSAHRREKSLMINEYLAIRELILSVAEEASQ